MGTVPTIPTFPAGLAAQGTAMQTLCTALTWCLTGRPLARLEQGTTQSFTTGIAAAVTWDTKIVDRDSGWSSGSNTRYTAQTPGIYLVSANITWASNSTGSRSHYFQVTTGSSNPAGSGVTTAFGFCALQASGVSGTNSRQLTPYMYVNDYLQVFAFQNSGGALSTSAADGQFFTIDHVSG